MNMHATLDPAMLELVFDRYHVGWETKNPDLIASLHSEDTLFWLHDGSAPVNGREALRLHCIELFRQFDFSSETVRNFYGDGHWVFEWNMVLNLHDTRGEPFTAKVEMLDVVTVGKDRLVTRKDVYMNGAQSQAAFSKAGIER